VQQPADVNSELLRLWSREEHAVVQRVQKAVLVDPTLLFYQDAMHDGDLPGRPTEAQ
jgi:hypothetical protein